MPLFRRRLTFTKSASVEVEVEAMSAEEAEAAVLERVDDGAYDAVVEQRAFEGDGWKLTDLEASDG